MYVTLNTIKGVFLNGNAHVCVDETIHEHWKTMKLKSEFLCTFNEILKSQGLMLALLPHPNSLEWQSLYTCIWENFMNIGKKIKKMKP